MAIVLRLLAVFALLAGLVLSASPVAAGEETLEPTEVEAEPAAEADATVTVAITADADATAVTDSAIAAEATVVAEEPLARGLTVAADASAGNAGGSGHWADAVLALTTPQAPPEAAPMPSTDPTDADVATDATAVESAPPKAPVADAAAEVAADAIDTAVELTDTVVAAAAETATDLIAVADQPSAPADADGDTAAVSQPDALDVSAAQIDDAMAFDPRAMRRSHGTQSAMPGMSAASSNGGWAFGASRVGWKTSAARIGSDDPTPARSVVRVHDVPGAPRASVVTASSIMELGVLRSSAPDAIDEPASAPALLASGAFVAAPRISTAVSVAMDFARLSGGWAGPLVFNLWLRRQLRERRMSQRQLGVMSGVNHSTISRLIAGSRTPNLETAAKLVHALRLEWTEEQVATYFDLLPERTLFPTQRVESALRGDGDLDDLAVREVMAHYLSVRQRRRASARAPGTGSAESAPPRITASGPDAGT